MSKPELSARLQALAPSALGVLRITTALVFMQHGVQKLFLWPPSEHHATPVALLSVFGIAGLLELVGGGMVLFGFLTRPVAFLLSGEMAVAYWSVHFRYGILQPGGWMPVVNEGDSAIQFCFVFLYLFFAGGGAWSLDRLRRS